MVKAHNNFLKITLRLVTHPDGAYKGIVADFFSHNKNGSFGRHLFASGDVEKDLLSAYEFAHPRDGLIKTRYFITEKAIFDYVHAHTKWALTLERTPKTGRQHSRPVFVTREWLYDNRPEEYEKLTESMSYANTTNQA